MKRKFIYGFVFLAFTATACNAPEELNGSEAKGVTPQRVLASDGPALAGVDVTPPLTVATVTPAEPDANGEYHNNVSIRLDATDDASGVETIFWSLSGAHTGSGSGTGPRVYIPVIARQGVTTVTFYSKDGSNNYEAAHTLDIKITPATGACTAVNLRDFNLFVTEDYTGGHDIRGKVAAGGNLDMHYFSVGAELPSDELENVLVAGGALTISHGGMFGNAHYGSNTTADGTVTFYRGALSQGTALNFWERGEEIAQTSGDMASLTVNGLVEFQSWGGLFLSGGHAKVNVFELDASLLSSTRYFSLSVPEGSVAVINVYGDAATVANFSNAYSGVDATGVVFNFPEATQLTAFNYGFFGTVVAPYAHVDFSNGSFDGGIYAASMSGNAEGHLAPLRSFIICGDGVGT